MSTDNAVETLESLGHWERLEDLSASFGLPHVPEFDMGYFQRLYYPELSDVLERLDAGIQAGADASAYGARGRVRRLFGDRPGALEDLRRALQERPGDAALWAWLGEADLRSDRALEALTEAGRLDPALPWPLLYRGAAYLLRRDLKAARADLTRFTAARPGSGLGWLLLGQAERGRSSAAAARAFERAAKAAPVCSAAYLLRAREAKSTPEAARWLRGAYDVSPVLGFITLQIHQTLAVESARNVKRMIRFSFSKPETIGAYYQREATQTHYSHFPAEDYSFVSALARRHPDLAWSQAFFGRAACYVPAGVAEGDKRLSRAIELSPHAGWFYAWRANARGLRGRVDEALADFATSVRLQPFYHRAFVWRGGLLRKLGRFAEALKDLDRALVMDPFYSLTYHERSLVRRGLGDWVGAVQDLERAFYLDARYRWVFHSGRPPTQEEIAKGLEDLDRAAARHPSVPSFLVWRGQLKLSRSDYSGAFADFEKAIHTDPQCALAYAWYGRGLSDAGLYERARRALARAVELEPRLWIAYGWLSEAAFLAGDRRAAEKTLRRVLREKPKTAWAFYLRARFQLAQGRAADAERALKRALLLDGKYPEAYLLQAEARLHRGRVAAAEESIAQCLEIAPNMGRAYLARAQVRLRSGRHAEVIADYRRVLEDFPYLLNEQERGSVRALLGAAGARAQAPAREEAVHAAA